MSAAETSNISPALRRSSPGVEAQLTAVTEPMRSRSEIESKIAARLESLGSLGARLRVRILDGVIAVDGTTKPATISHGEGDCDCAVDISDFDFLRVLGGEIAPEKLFQEGKMKIEGDIVVAWRFHSIMQCK